MTTIFFLPLQSRVVRIRRRYTSTAHRPTQPHSSRAKINRVIIFFFEFSIEEEMIDVRDHQACDDAFDNATTAVSHRRYERISVKTNCSIRFDIRCSPQDWKTGRSTTTDWWEKNKLHSIESSTSINYYQHEQCRQMSLRAYCCRRTTIAIMQLNETKRNNQNKSS